MRCVLRLSEAPVGNGYSRVLGGIMGRSKVRGIEMAGVKLAIEVPSNCSWQWPTRELEELSGPPLDADVQIGVRVGKPRRVNGETFRYESRGIRFEIGWEGEDWAVAVYGKSGLERTARFDADFKHGEIVIDPEHAAAAPYPLEYPLDDLILLHRLTREGCIVVSGSVSVTDGEALLFLESHTGVPASALGMQTSQRSSEHFVLRPVHSKDSSNSNQVWLYATPWHAAHSATSWQRVPLQAIHVLCPGGDQPFEALDPGDAENEILQHVFAPVHDPDAATRLLEVVSHIARRTSVLKMRQPKLSREISFNWDSPQSSMGFASAPM
ncbi:MAG: hypothetical protein ACI8W3_001697 [Myxococcota bacterium]|jgi:hypothetical protein